MKPLILIVECTENFCSVAVVQASKLLQLVEKKDANPSIYLPGLISEAMSESRIEWNKLSAIVVNVGPGSYTSLRSTISLVKGLAFAKNIKVIPVSKDLVMAYSIPTGFKEAYIYLHSRGNEALKFIYDANYQRISFEFVALELIQNEISSSEETNRLFIMEENLQTRLNIESKKNQIKLFYPGAKNIIYIANKYFLENKFCNLKELLPIYFKDPKITTPKKIFKGFLQ